MSLNEIVYDRSVRLKVVIEVALAILRGVEGILCMLIIWCLRIAKKDSSDDVEDVCQAETLFAGH